MSEGYTVGGDTLWEIVPPLLIGQTFSPLHAHKLEYIDINAEVTTKSGNLYATLHDLADDPNMIGGGISTTRHTDWPRRWWFEISRIRFIMKKVQLKVGHTYGILIHSEPAPWWNKHRVQYDRWDATYPRGKRFTKADWAAAPVYFDDDDLIFVEFGEPTQPAPIPEPPPPLPPPPPDPPVDHWYIRGVEQYRTATGYIIYIWTNVPCHLFMRWTTIDPKIHKIPVLRRGLYLHADIRICFVAYEDNEQQEEGDTVFHTFVKEPWPICETRWFMFLGTVDGKEVPSTSGLFSKHRKAIPGPSLILRPIWSNKTDYHTYPPELHQWECLDDIVPDEDETYIYQKYWKNYHATMGGYLDYSFPPGWDAPIKKIEVVSRQRYVGTPPQSFQMFLGLRAKAWPHTVYGHLHDTNYPDYQYAIESFSTDPRDGTPWTRAKVESFYSEFTVDVQGSAIEGDGWGRVTQMYLAIYT